MPRAPLLPMSFNSPSLVSTVLGDPTFASRGYLWGFDGRVHYCFYNPNKIKFEIWKKEWYLRAFIGMVIGAGIGAWFGGFKGAIAGAFLTSFIPFLLPQHYYKTAEDQAAPIVTNGPQMELPFNMQFGAVAAISAVLLIAPTVIGGIIGFLAGTVTIPGLGNATGWVVGLALGALTGVNLFSLFLLLLGLGATPFGSVLGATFSEPVATPIATTAFLQRLIASPAFSSYSIGMKNPTAVWGSGGLIPIIIARVVGAALPGAAGTSYADLVAEPRPVVVWGLIPFDLRAKPELLEAMTPQREVYGQDIPKDGIVIVAGCEKWTNTETSGLVTHGTTDAVGTDGSQSALLGSEGDFVIGGGWSPRDLGSYRDPIQRYGFKAV